MRATEYEFRFRYLIHVLIFVVGFTAPWNYSLHLDQGSLWLLGAVYLARTGAFTLASATIALLVLGIVCATMAAWLRTWGTAYLSPAVVGSAAMQGTSVVADGPLRYMRNPLYAGVFLHTLALALLMPATGAAFAVVAFAVFELRLIFGEESFLEGKLGAAYAAYRAMVPRILPSLKARVAASGGQPVWGQAMLAEIYFWGVAASFGVAGWRYNASLLQQCVVVSFGVSLVARAVSPQRQTPVIPAGEQR